MSCKRRATGLGC